MSRAFDPSFGSFDLLGDAPEHRDPSALDAPAWPPGFPHPTQLRRSPRALPRITRKVERPATPVPVRATGRTLVPDEALLDHYEREVFADTPADRAPKRAYGPPGADIATEERPVPQELRGLGSARTIVPWDDDGHGVDALVAALPEPLPRRPDHVTYEEVDLEWFGEGTFPPPPSRVETAPLPGLAGPGLDEAPPALGDDDWRVWILLTAVVLAAATAGVASFGAAVWFWMAA